MVIPLVILYELVWVFKRLKIDSKVVLTIIESIIESDKASLVEERYHDILNALNFIVNFKVSLAHFNDLVILQVAKSLGYPVYTFDRKMASFGEKLGVKVYLI